MNKKTLISIEVKGKGFRNVATMVEEYARECGLSRMHGELQDPDFSRVAWVEFPFDEKFKTANEASEALAAKCRRPDLALMASYGHNQWVAMTVRS